MMQFFVMSVALSFMILGTTAHSQDSVIDSDKISAILSLGYNGSMRTNFTPIAGIELNISNGADLYGVHLFHTTEMIGLGGGDAPSDIGEEITGLGVTYGRSHSFTLGRPLFPLFPIALLSKQETQYRIIASIGLSLNKSHLHGGIETNWDNQGSVHYVYEFKNRFGLGVPVQLEFVQMLTKSVGYVHRLYANVNSHRSFWSFSWAVQYIW